MNFFEEELQKIVSPRYPDAVYVGRACYVSLSDSNRAKIQFITGRISNQYDALLVTILNRNEGAVDKLQLKLADLLGEKKVSNPNFRKGISPHIWDDCGRAQWYVYTPNGEDYRRMSEAVHSYLEVFQEQRPADHSRWQQSM